MVTRKRRKSALEAQYQIDNKHVVKLTNFQDEFKYSSNNEHFVCKILIHDIF